VVKNLLKNTQLLGIALQSLDVSVLLIRFGQEWRASAICELSFA